MSRITHQAHGAVAQPVDLRAILAQLSCRELAAVAGDLADDLLHLVHCGVWKCRISLLLCWVLE